MAVKISSYRNRVKTGLPSNAEELGQGCRMAVLGTFDSNRVIQSCEMSISVHTMDNNQRAVTM